MDKSQMNDKLVPFLFDRTQPIKDDIRFQIIKAGMGKGKTEIICEYCSIMSKKNKDFCVILILNCISLA